MRLITYDGGMMSCVWIRCLKIRPVRGPSCGFVKMHWVVSPTQPQPLVQFVPFFGPLQENGRSRELHKNKIYQRYHDCLLGMGHLISMGEDVSA